MTNKDERWGATGIQR